MLASALVALLPFLGAASAAPLDRRDTGVYIYAGRDNKCLSLPVGATPGDGTPVVSLDCARAGLSKWDINRGSGSVVLTGTNFALDIGLNPGNNGALKVWTSYPTAPQQTWYYTDDNRIAQTGGNQCLDEGDNGIQTYQCTTGNTNQIFYTRSGGVTPPSSSSVMPSSTSSASPPPASSSATPPPSGGSLIKANAYDNLCLTVRDANIYDGNPVQMSPCASAGDSGRSQQVWQVAPGTTGPIRLPGTNKCLDAGNNPADGSGVKIWQCYDGLLQQTWSVGANGLFALSNNQCLNVQRETGSFVQTWTCSASDPQDQFSVVAA